MANHKLNASLLNRERFGTKLKAARKREGFRTVQDLSRHLAEAGTYISARTLHRYEQGTHIPSCELLAALIKILPSDRGSFYFDSVNGDDSMTLYRINPRSLFGQFRASRLGK